MTLSLLVYGTVLGLLLALATHFLEDAFRKLGGPGRWLWMAALGGSGLLPLVFLLAPATAPYGIPGGVRVPLDALYALGPAPGGGGPGWVSLRTALEGPLPFLWVGATILVLLAFAGGGLRLHLRAKGWTRAHLVGREVLVSRETGPAVVGLLRPRMVLPSWALDMDREELEMILVHEEEHVRARDPALLAGAILFTAAAPWNPTLWWGLRRLRLAVEADCDARVLARGVGRAPYGALLLGVASGSRQRFPLAPALVEGGGSILERRLLMMKSHVGKKRVFGAASGAVVAGGFLFLACETPVPPTTVEPEMDAVSVPVQKLTEPEGFMVRGNPERAKNVSDDGTTIIGDLMTMGESQHIRLQPVDEDGGASVGDAPLVYVDGVLQEGGMAVVQELDPGAIDRIEIVKGAAARAVFGEEAANGVIQIFLKEKPRD